MPPKPGPTNKNAINMKDVATTTSPAGDVVVVLDNKCTNQLPELVYARGVLTKDYANSTAPVPVSIPAGTILKVAAVTKAMDQCTVRLAGPNNETLSGASVLLFFAAFENAN
ncbi:hypothetical protein KKC22_08015 [Myxococcota bacterium]|nr:hypothetical protein [Myxococcota bacterium]